MLRSVVFLITLLPCALAGQSGVDALKRSADAGQRVFDRRVAGGGLDTTVMELSDVDKQPEFPGGEQAMYAFLGKNIRYPGHMEGGGKVHVQFVIGADGRVGDVEVKRGLAPAFDKEVVRAVSSMPDWTPAELDGRKVAVRYRLPVSFTFR